jgi:hypothetical protein
VNPDFAEESFMVWASDHMVYGPVDLPTLIEWAKDKRVFPRTWVMAAKQNRWCHAEAIEPLREHFVNDSIATPQSAAATPDAAVIATELRQFPLFSGLTNEQLEQFAHFGELVQAHKGLVIIKRNDQSDSLFFLLEGQARVRLMIGYEDRTLVRMKAGECFGEMAMFTKTPRSADVVAESDARLLRLTSEACHLLIAQLPQIAAPILYGMAQLMASRIAGVNQQYQKEVSAEFLWR